MLPDYPALKKDLAGLLNRYMRQRLSSHLGFAAKFPKHRIFEGDRSTIERSTGDAETNPFEHLEAKVEIEFVDLPGLTLKEVLTRIDSLAADMASNMKKFMFRRMDETLDAAGQTFDAKGEKMSGALLLRMMEGIEMSFGDDGQVRGLALVMHPDNTDRAVAALRELDTDPELSEKYRAVLEKKREQWREREASRRLVG